ncbi:hypothetical protein ASF64_19875 [Arthrobacter sp. Leaf137]|nr:hypothetical protein ASF64_19875 [Arthrobacter sp. Leaf137]
MGSVSGAVTGTGTGVELQPGLSLVWLQASQSPWPLEAVVPPPWRQGVMWSWWRMGASQYGVRQVSSRIWRKRLSPAGKSLALASKPTSSPLPGAV